MSELNINYDNNGLPAQFTAPGFDAWTRAAGEPFSGLYALHVTTNDDMLVKALSGKLGTVE